MDIYASRIFDTSLEVLCNECQRSEHSAKPRKQRRTLSKEEARAPRWVVAHLMQLTREHCGPAEEHAHILSDARKYAIPDRPAQSESVRVAR